MDKEISEMIKSVNRVEALHQRCLGKVDEFERQMKRLARDKPSGLAAYVQKEFHVRASLNDEGKIIGTRTGFVFSHDPDLNDFISKETHRRKSQCRVR